MLASCQQAKNQQMTDIDLWKLGWRMIASSMEGQYELAETEDIENLNKRRMEIGMMPIEMYKEFMLKGMQ